MAHSDNVCEAVDYTYRILHGLALAYRRIARIRKTYNVASQLHHGRGKTKSRPRARLVEQRRQLLAATAVCIPVAMRDYILGKRDYFVCLLHRQIRRLDKMSHVRQLFKSVK